jgi:hypothetical protein
VPKSTVDFSKNVSNLNKLADLRSTFTEWIGEKYGSCRMSTSNFNKGWQVYVEKTSTVDFGVHRAPLYPLSRFARNPPPPPFQRPSADYSQRHPYNFGIIQRR